MEQSEGLSEAAKLLGFEGREEELGKYVNLSPDEIEDLQASDEEVLGSQRAILEHLEKRKAYNTIVLKDANTRNLIFLGRTRAGKSTALQTLKDPFVFAKECSLFSETVEPRLFSFTIEYGNAQDNTNVNYNVNIMDTPGLFERSTDPSAARDNEILKHMIHKCLEFEITKLHSLFFVCSFEAGINKEDIEAIKELNKLFEGANKQFHLLITHSEGKLPSRTRQLEAQVKAIPELQDFFKNPGVKVFFIGALHHDDFEMAAGDAIRAKTNNILKQRTDLYRHLFESSEYCHIYELEFYKQQHRTIDELRDLVKETTQKLKEHQGAAEEKEKLQKELAIQTDSLSTAAGVVARITGQDKMKVLEEVVANARALTATE